MKKIFSIIAVCLLGIVAFTSCSKDDEVLTGNISGLVSDYTNANSPIAGATVTLSGKGLTKTTGSDGRFEFVDLEPGTYTISVAANSFQPTTKQVTVYAGENVLCDFQLSKGSTNVDITPMNLVFGKGVEQLSFSIKNNSNSALTYSISNAPDYIEVTPMSGTVAAKGTQAISVHVVNRSSITSNRSGQITVNVGNDSYIVSINVTNNTTTSPDDPNNGDDDNPGTSSGSTEVTRGLLAYYTFDDGKSATNTYDPMANNGQINGSAKFVTGNNGKGYSLNLKNGQYVNIPSNMLNGKKVFTVCMWVKDFGQGYLFVTDKSDYPAAPSIRVDETDHFCYWYNIYSSQTVKFSNSVVNLQTGGWHHIAITQSSSQTILYIDGVMNDTQGISGGASEGASMRIGSQNTDEMTVDNVRIHGVTLNAEEIAKIYKSEK